MTSSNGNLFPVTDPLCGEFTGHWCVPFTKASDVELWCFLWSTPDQAISNISFIWFEWIWCLTQQGMLTLLRKPNQFMMTSSNGNIFRVTGHFYKGQWRGALMFYLLCACGDGWVNNRKAGDVRRLRIHYDVTDFLACLRKLCSYWDPRIKNY